MADPRTFMAILAAGASRRFGATDKLSASFRGKRLGEHVSANAPHDLIATDCAFVIATSPNHPSRPAWEKAGFRVAINRNANQGMGTSVALAADLATKARCDAVLIALADMPMVPRRHFEALVEACSDPDDAICSSDGTTRMPPAVFGAAHFSTLASLSGDKGARSLLQNARALECPRDWLVDIDTPDALAALD